MSFLGKFVARTILLRNHIAASRDVGDKYLRFQSFVASNLQLRNVRYNHPVCHPAGPHVLHAGSSLLEDVTVRSTKCWYDCISLGAHMPIESIRLYNGSRDLISVSPLQPLTEEMSVYHNSLVPTGVCLAPPVVSTKCAGVPIAL